ncbi:MAG TPA: phosphonopyruvate decarboxylase [Candidatus Limnocylindria bacterium]|nr:phosphonopyruvate decarboxylase [Candidatus Limnocylindria bacterium]
MLSPGRFYGALVERGVDFFTGVPDSLLKDFCAYVDDVSDASRHIITANEGNAVALASGYHLGTGRIALVYLQNSGLGNAVNPLTSLADPEVYSIPLLLVVGWRGAPGRKDEPQHVKQGRITPGLLDLLGIPHRVLPDSTDEALAALDEAVGVMRRSSRPYALLVEDGTFEPYAARAEGAGGDGPDRLPLTREEALHALLDLVGPRDLVVSTTGKTSRELVAYRERAGQSTASDFLTVGSMGHASMIALGVALTTPRRTVYCVDGDGAVLMHMGALPIIGVHGPPNLRHVVINNGSHDSVGGQRTVAMTIDLPGIAMRSGYREVRAAEDATSLRDAMRELSACPGPTLLEVRVRRGARANLGRPKTRPIDNKTAFMSFVEE